MIIMVIIVVIIITVRAAIGIPISLYPYKLLRGPLRALCNNARAKRWRNVVAPRESNAAGAASAENGTCCPPASSPVQPFANRPPSPDVLADVTAPLSSVCFSWSVSLSLRPSARVRATSVRLRQRVEITRSYTGRLFCFVFPSSSSAKEKKPK